VDPRNKEMTSHPQGIPLVPLATGIAAVLVLVALLFLPSFAPYLLRFEHWTADWRTAVLADRPATQDRRIGLVLINDETLKDYASSPIDRGLLARLVKAIDDTGPRAIGLDILFLKKTESEKDQALLGVLAATRAKVILGALDERGELQEFQKAFQQSYLAEARRPAGYLNLHHDRDDVVRYAAPPAPNPIYPKSFAALLGEAAGVTSADDTSRPIPWLGSPKEGTELFLVVRAQDLLADSANGARLKDRLVLVGGGFPLAGSPPCPAQREGWRGPAGRSHSGTYFGGQARS